MTYLSGARVVAPDGVLDDGWVGIRDGRIAQLGAGVGVAPDGAAQLSGGWLLPGYIDLHVHGGGGYDVTNSPEAMAGAAHFHLEHGTTGMLAPSA